MIMLSLSAITTASLQQAKSAEKSQELARRSHMMLHLTTCGDALKNHR